MTPPRNGGRSSDTDLIAPVVALRRRAIIEEGESEGAQPPAGEYDVFDQPAPRLTNRDMWDGRANRLHKPTAAPTELAAATREHATPPAHPHRPAAPRVLAVAGVLALTAITVAVVVALAVRHTRTPADRSPVTASRLAASLATNSKPPPLRQPRRRRGRGPQTGRGRRMSAPRVISARERSRASGPAPRRTRPGPDDPAGQQCDDEHHAGASASACPVVERCEEAASRCARVVGNQPEQVRAGRPGVLSQRAEETSGR